MTSNPRRKPFYLLLVLSLVPILLWPLIFFGSIFMFDAPREDYTIVWIGFILINAYPIPLIANAIVSWLIVKKRRNLGLLMLSLPIASFIAFLVWFLA